MARTAIVMCLLLSTGCLSSPEPPSCAELAPGSAGCGPADAAAVDGSMDGGGPDAAAPDAAGPDRGPIPDGDPVDAKPTPVDAGPTPDAAPDMGRCGPERCNGLDDDCDGVIDEQTGGEACVSGVGRCAAEGVEVCVEEMLACGADNPAPVAEVCNDLDDDCDGWIDERQIFTSDLFEGGGIAAVERPAIAALDGFFLIARRVTSEGRGVQLDPGEAIELTLYDRRGQPLEHRVAGQNAETITAYTALRFTNGGDAGFVVLWADRVDEAGAELHQIKGLVAFPTADGFGDVDGPVILRQTQGPVTALDGVASAGGIGAAWIVGGSPRFGFLDFAVDPPGLSALPIGDERLEPVEDIAITVASERFFVAYTEGRPAMRQRGLKLVRLDSGAGPARAPVDAAAGDRLAGPSLGGRDGQVFLAWSEVVGGNEQVRAMVFDTDAEARSAVVEVTDGQAPAVSPRLAVNRDAVGLAWAQLDDADGDRSTVWFTRLVEAVGRWDAAPATVRLSDGPARSGPLDLAVDDLFGAVWSDNRRQPNPSAWARFGPYTCNPDVVGP